MGKHKNFKRHTHLLKAKIFKENTISSAHEPELIGDSKAKPKVSGDSKAKPKVSGDFKAKPKASGIISEKFHDESNPGIVAVSIFIGAFIIYVRTMHSSLSGGDSGELIVVAFESGVAHPPGYPIFTLLAKLFITLIPFGSVAWRVNLLSVICASACCCFLYLSIYKLTCNHGAGLVGACMFGFSRLVWTWSVCAEVFSLNNLLLSLLLFIAVMFEQSEKQHLQKNCLLGSLVCGLCLANQHTSILYISVIVPWVFYHLWDLKSLTVSILLKSSLSFLCGLLPYAYLPISSWLNTARWTWGNQSTVQGFLTHFFRMEYGTLDLLKDHTGQGFYVGFRAYIHHSLTDFTGPFMMLFLLSIWYLHGRQQSLIRVPSFLVICWIMFLVYLLFFCWRANLDINKPLFFKVVERFWIQGDLIVCILAAVTYSDIMRYTSNLLALKRLDLTLVLAVLITGFQISKNWSWCDQSNNIIIEDFAKQSLGAFPHNAIILTKGDLPSNTFRYFHLCENVRQDLQLFDQEVLTYEWSVPTMRQFYPGIVFPGDMLRPTAGKLRSGNRAFTFKDFIDANYDRHPMFACIGVQDHEPSWEVAYTLWPYGVCYRLVKKGTVLDVDKWLQNTSTITHYWSYPWSSIDDGTWEYVANSEMWRARTTTALFFLEQAMELPEGSKEAAKLLLRSYELYTGEMKKYQSVPSFWHRNYAIVCERLARLDTKLSTLALLRKTKEHFAEFLLLEPDSLDADKIQAAIQTLESYLNSALTT